MGGEAPAQENVSHPVCEGATARCFQEAHLSQAGSPAQTPELRPWLQAPLALLERSMSFLLSP